MKPAKLRSHSRASRLISRTFTQTHRSTSRGQTQTRRCISLAQTWNTCWWLRCPISLYPSARTRAPSRDISLCTSSQFSGHTENWSKTELKERFAISQGKKFNENVNKAINYMCLVSQLLRRLQLCSGQRAEPISGPEKCNQKPKKKKERKKQDRSVAQY